MIAALERKLAMAGRRAAMAAAGGLLIVAGAGFFVLALWILLAAAHGAAVASLVTGALLTGAGLVTLGLSRRKARQSRPPVSANPPRSQDMLPAAVEAFFVGLNTAMAIRRGR